VLLNAMAIDLNLVLTGTGTRLAVSNNTVWNRTQWNSSKHAVRTRSDYRKQYSVRRPQGNSLKENPLPESASELYRPSDRRLSAKSVTNVADRGCHVVSVTDPYARILGFLDKNRYSFFQVAPQLYS
jgi:hypothetical protein